jgi:hypothetical protein
MNTTVIVASLASATALAASSSLTPAMPESADPIFALIERHRAAFADDVAFTEHQDARGNEVGGIQLALAETRPATLAGVIAIIQYEREHRTNFPGCHLFPSDDEAGEALDPRAKLGNWLATIDRSIAEIARVNPSLAVPELAAPAVATPTILEDTPAGALVRFEMTLATLRDRYICDGWSLDEKAAEQVLQYFRERAAAGTWAIDEDSPTGLSAVIFTSRFAAAPQAQRALLARTPSSSASSTNAWRPKENGFSLARKRTGYAASSKRRRKRRAVIGRHATRATWQTNASAIL